MICNDVFLPDGQDTRTNWHSLKSASHTESYTYALRWAMLHGNTHHTRRLHPTPLFSSPLRSSAPPPSSPMSTAAPILFIPSSPTAADLA